MSKASYKAWVQNNRERRREIDREYRLRNPEKCQEREREKRRKTAVSIDARVKKWCAENPQRRKAIKSRWKKANLGKLAAYTRKRRAKEKNATPAWADETKIIEIYERASLLTKMTGISHHVDHIIPLTHRFVCGLHHEDNLQILTGTENVKKSNRFVSLET